MKFEDFVRMDNSTIRNFKHPELNVTTNDLVLEALCAYRDKILMTTNDEEGLVKYSMLNCAITDLWQQIPFDA